MQEYLCELSKVLRRAFCLHNFPSPLVERFNKPIIEDASPPEELVLPPVVVRRPSSEECMLLEQSINSVRVSFRFKPADQIEKYLLSTFLRFMLHRADDLDIVRRVPLPSYDLTFLVTWRHLEQYRQDALIDFICQFVEDLPGELSSMKLSLKARARAVAASYWQVVEQQHAAGSNAAAAGAGRRLTRKT